MRNGRLICILSFSHIARDARVLRQIEYASREYRVDVVGYERWTPPWPNVQFWEVKRVLRQRLHSLQQAILLVAGRLVPSFWMKAYWDQSNHREALKILLRNRYDIIHANDLGALPLAIMAAERTGSKVIFDAHEYSPSQAMYSLGSQRILYSGYVGHLLRSFGPRADAFVTVAESIAKLYRQNFGLDAMVIMNAPTFGDVEFRPVEPTQIRLIHHGAAKSKRGLENLIEMAGFLDDIYTLHFMLVRDKGDYARELERLAARVAPGRVFFRTPVLPSQVVTTIAEFDIGVYILPPLVLNQKYALPNKFFEFIAAGLPVAIGPSPEMARLVRKYCIGVIAEGFRARDLATALNNLTVEEINQMKRNALKAARSLNAEVEMGKLMSIYRKLLA